MARKPFVDGLRVVASLAVVTIHVTARHAGWPATTGTPCVANVAYVMGALCHFAVPLFLMVTGALLLGRAEAWAGFFEKRYSRLLPPFLAWNLVYLALALISASNLSYAERLGQFALKLESFYHLWYLPMLLWITLFVPLVNDAIVGRKMTSGDWRVCIGIGCAFILLNHVASVLAQTGCGRPAWFNGTPFLVCLLLGYWLNEQAGRLQRWLPVFVVAVTGTLISGLVFGFCNRGSGVDVLLFNNLGCLSLQSASALFLIFRCREYRWLDNKWVRSLGDCSFGIYLVHPFFLRITERLFGQEIDLVFNVSSHAGVAFFFMFLVIGVYACSYTTVVLLRKTELGRLIS